MAEQISAIRRDTDLEQRMLEAVIADRNDQPRSKQLQAGPSSIGFCRELLRNTLFPDPNVPLEPESSWATAAHVGSVMGEDLERVFGQRLDALTQQRITALFSNLGLQISGAIDLAFIDRNLISDLKSVDDMGGTLYSLEKNASIIDTLLSIWREGLLYAKNIETPDGGYELTEVMISKLAKLHYYVQVAIYVAGAIQAGVLQPDAEARLVFYDRAGSFQEFVALVITNEELQMFFDIAQHRIEQVIDAQEAFEATGGNPAVIAHLRDQPPSFCFSKKVQCPLRMVCWMGSEWTAENQITSPEIISAVDRYEAGRDMATLGNRMKRAAREDLREVQGVLPDGRMVSWTRGGTAINVVATTRRPEVAAAGVLAVAERAQNELAEADAAAEQEKAEKAAAPAETEEQRRAQLKKLQVAELKNILSSDYDLPTKGLKAELIERIIEHEEWTKPTPPTDRLLEQAVLDEEAHQRGPQESDPAETSVATQVMEEDAEEEQRGVDFAKMLAEAEVAEPTETVLDAIRDAGNAPVTIMVDEQPFLCSCGSRFFYQLGERTWDCTACGQRYGDALSEEPPTPPNAEVLEAMRVPKHEYEDTEVLRRRQALFGLPLGELADLASSHGIELTTPQAVIQRIIDAEFKPKVGRGWQPAEDGRDERLRAMQHDAEAGIRERLGQTTPEQVQQRIERGA